MEPTYKDWTSEAVTTPENHAAWSERLTRYVLATQGAGNTEDPLGGFVVLDSQVAPGQPVPKEMEPEEPKPTAEES